MNNALWIAKTGLDAQQTRMSVISNNLANVNTTGYKQGRASFEDLLYQNVRQAGGQSSQDTILPSGLMLGTGVRTVSTEKIFTQGNLVQTENSLDLAILGQGFFQILRPDGGLGYSRDGSFQKDAQGQLVTSNGYLLQPAITVPEDALTITIGTDGVISVMQQGQTTPTQIGTLQLTSFVNPAGLQPAGENMYLETGASGSPQQGNPGLNGLGIVQQGSLETSNVNVVEEMVSMIEAQRAYEMNSKVIAAVDQMLQFASNNL